MLFDKVHHLLLRPCIHTAFNRNPMLSTIILDQFICTETLMTFFTVHQRIRKSTQMAGSHPCLRIHKNRTVHTYIVWRFLNKFLPPCTFYVILQLHTEISVIPGICQTTVNFRARIHKASCFCQSHDFFHCFFHVISPKIFSMPLLY